MEALLSTESHCMDRLRFPAQKMRSFNYFSMFIDDRRVFDKQIPGLDDDRNVRAGIKSGSRVKVNGRSEN